MTSAVEQAVQCPCCDADYKTHMLSSTNTFGGQTTDLHTLAAGFDPLGFMIATCPQCGYTDHTARIKSGDVQLSDAVKAQVRETISPRFAEGKPTDAQRYQIAAEIAQWRDEEALIIADFYLKAAWLAANTGVYDDERAYRQQAIPFFEQVMANPPAGRAEPVTIAYLLGELYRRTKDRETAAVWYNRAIELSGDELRNAEIKKLAAQQRDNPREMMS